MGWSVQMYIQQTQIFLHGKLVAIIVEIRIRKILFLSVTTLRKDLVKIELPTSPAHWSPYWVSV